MPDVLQQFSEGEKEKPLTNVQWRQAGEKKGVPWMDLESDGKRITCTGDVGILSPRKKQSKEVPRAG